MDIIAAQARSPTFVEAPDDLGIGTPVMEGLRYGKTVVKAMSGLISAEHGFTLPFHEWPTAFRIGRFPLVKQIDAIDLGAAVFSGVIGTERGGHAAEDRLGGRKVERRFETWRDGHIRESIGLAFDGLPAEERSIIAGIAE